jgi:diguanylate cyclase (GGDEF)-like protein
MTEGDRAEEEVHRILVVEDDREMRHLLSVILGGEGREVVLAEDGAQAEEGLSDELSLVFLDLFLPDTDGRTLLRQIRARPATGHLPVVVASARASAEIRAECFALGADAFWEKPFDPELVAKDVAARLQWRAERERRHLTDELTGYLNRAGILEAVDGAVERGGLFLLTELDGYRRLSDRYGWGTAERIVWEVGRAMEKALPAGAVIGRMGGGQFAVVADVDAVSEGIAETILEAARSLPVEGPDGETFRVTASVAQVELAGPRDALLEDTETLLFRARSAGGNRVARVDDGPPDAAASGSGPILVAEDDDIAATILTHRLEKEGLEVIRYADGASAYQGALEVTPALVILDVKMPGMDGFEVLERLRKTPTYAEVPIVLLTSMGSEADVVRAFQLGADDYILKPFSPAELVARARRLISRGHMPAGI